MDNRELVKKLEQLNNGESITLEINGETIQYTKPVENITCSEHYYVEDKPEGSSSCAKCRNCPNGTIYDPKIEKLVNGQLVRL